MSPATIDQLFKPTKQARYPAATSATRPGATLRSSIVVRRAMDEMEQAPGFFEIDLVVHCGHSLKGEHAWTPLATKSQTERESLHQDGEQEQGEPVGHSGPYRGDRPTKAVGRLGEQDPRNTVDQGHAEQSVGHSVMRLPTSRHRMRTESVNSPVDAEPPRSRVRTPAARVDSKLAMSALAAAD